MENNYDAVVVGSGPGGAAAARELTLAGKKVVLLELGADHQWIGNSVAASRCLDLKNATPFGHPIMVRGITTGGSSLVFCGAATRPADWIAEQTGIDLIPIAEQTEKELKIAPLPDRLIGEGARRIMEAANDLDIAWEPIPKFIDPEKCEPDCGACMVGCKTGAKWTAREYIKEAVAHGMELRTRVMVNEVIQENGTAVGVRGRSRGRAIEVRAGVVVLAAGGLGTPVILKRSGIEAAGDGLFCDPLVFTYGIYEGKGSGYDVPMTAGTWQFHQDEGYLMTDNMEPRMLQLASLAMKGPQHLPKALKFGKTLGIMVKVKDPISGTIDRDGKISKELEDIVWERLNSGDRRAREILLKVGCHPDSLITTPVKGAHPGGTAPIGKVVNSNLETEIKNCYVADASVVPDELGTPVVLLVLCLGKYAARKILEA